MRIHTILLILAAFALTSCSAGMPNIVITVVTQMPTIQTPTTNVNEIRMEPTQTLSPMEIPVPTPVSKVIEIKEFENGKVTLQIPKLKINSPVDAVEVTMGIMGSSEAPELGDNPVWISLLSKDTISGKITKITKDIGEEGAALIYGHRQWGITPMVFNNLDKIARGDLVIVKTENRTLTFEVFNITVVYPNQVWTTIDAQDKKAVAADSSQLAIETCTPWGTTWQRLIVFAALKEEGTK